ncbi:unnamed protein product [Amoebophrya sp. A25]|nr:unnamed protein product [Amoebophrya sp. A25]|eukprot:GSA25T00011379001.1
MQDGVGNPPRRRSVAFVVAYVTLCLGALAVAWLFVADGSILPTADSDGVAHSSQTLEQYLLTRISENSRSSTAVVSVSDTDPRNASSAKTELAGEGASPEKTNAETPTRGPTLQAGIPSQELGSAVEAVHAPKGDPPPPQSLASNAQSATSALSGEIARRKKRRQEVHSLLYMEHERASYSEEVRNNYALSYSAKYHHHEHSIKIADESNAIDAWLCAAKSAVRRTGHRFHCERSSKDHTPADAISSPITSSPVVHKENPRVCPFLTASNLQASWATPSSGLLRHLYGTEDPSPSLEGLLAVEFEESEQCPKDERQANLGSCAVVGNSNNVEFTGLGAEIDAHETVFRFSCAPTRGFEADVGSKTTFRFVYPEAMGGNSDLSRICGSVIPEEDLQQTTALVFLYKEPDINWWLLHLRRPKKFLIRTPQPCCAYSNVPHPTKWKSRFKAVRILSPRWIEDAVALDPELALERGTNPKQGLIGIQLALQRCTSVSVYGFGIQDKEGNKISHAHYYDLT